jgi:hypothetical protein|mmetsp:Transcript_4593/g.16293  ORF Transcript_4593/g.16293 Transcript_4593/m.16293 type:complete len:81 (+) Transcript_4593:1572-1814(+)
MQIMHLVEAVHNMGSLKSVNLCISRYNALHRLVNVMMWTYATLAAWRDVVQLLHLKAVDQAGAEALLLQLVCMCVVHFSA